jgi:flagellin
MSLSIQTNVASLDAQNAIRVNTNFQKNTIEQLSSGYRINSSGDDAAGLAVANQYAGTIATLSQGVLNANNAVSTLQIADGGISNISTILNRLQTLATESASSTFAGNRTTVNNEYQGLLTEINRQAAAINLNTGGTYNTNLVTYVGGGNNQANSQVSVNLTGNNNAVDATALGIANTSVAGGGTSLTNNNVLLSDTATQFLSAGSQTLNFNIGTQTGNVALAVTVSGTDAGGTYLTGQQVVDSLNTKLNSYGISAGIGTNGQLQLSGAAAFSVTAGTQTAGNAIVVGTGGANSATTSYGINQGDYNATSTGFAAITAGTETIVFQNASGSTSVDLTAANAGTTANALSALNSQLSGTGIYAVQAANGTDISFQSSSSFNINETANATGDLFGLATPGAVTVNAPSAAASATGNAISALSALSTAISNLGLTQGVVGAGENKLNYAINLAQSQITNFSAAESGIKDADVAAEAASLTKAQVLQQASLAALAQANSAPQSVLSLLKG